MDKAGFQAEGWKAELNDKLNEYRRELTKEFGTSFLASIYISLLVLKRKIQLKQHFLDEVSKHY